MTFLRRHRGNMNSIYWGKVWLWDKKNCLTPAGEGLSLKPLSRRPLFKLDTPVHLQGGPKNEAILTFFFRLSNKLQKILTFRPIRFLHTSFPVYIGLVNMSMICEFTHYSAMHFSAMRGLAIACRPSVCLSVCLSVTLLDCDHIGWKSWKVIA